MNPGASPAACSLHGLRQPARQPVTSSHSAGLCAGRQTQPSADNQPAPATLPGTQQNGESAETSSQPELAQAEAAPLAGSTEPETAADISSSAEPKSRLGAATVAALPDEQQQPRESAAHAVADLPDGSRQRAPEESALAAAANSRAPHSASAGSADRNTDASSSPAAEPAALGALAQRAQPAAAKEATHPDAGATASSQEPASSAGLQEQAAGEPHALLWPRSVLIEIQGPSAPACWPACSCSSWL